MLWVLVCGDGRCEEEDEESCSNCPADCGRCPLHDWEIALISAAISLIVLTVAAIVLVSKNLVASQASYCILAEKFLKIPLPCFYMYLNVYKQAMILNFSQLIQGNS